MLCGCRGGEFHKSVKKTTTWLLAGEKPGQSKLAAAAKWGTRVLSEAQFFQELERLILQKQGYL
jgi:NAD-dependent DNA ligase